MRKPQFAVLGISLVVVFLSSYVLFTRWNNASQATQLKRFYASLQQTKEWRDEARAFNANKAPTEALFAGATRVQSFRLATIRDLRALQSNAGGVPTGRELGPEFAAQIGRVVLDPKSYSDPGSSHYDASFEPNVDFRVWNRRRYVDVLISPDSHIVVVDNNLNIAETNWNSVVGRSVVQGEATPARDEIIALAKKAFP